MSSRLEKAILKTLVYADIFDYPLTIKEIGKYLIKVKITSQSEILLCKTAKDLKFIKYKNSFYYLIGRENIVKTRREREQWSVEKIKKADKISRILKFIPTVKLIGVTGALAVNNSKEEDDIDLLIVTKRGLLWTTRFLVTIICELINVRRRPGDKETNNKICLNMFLDEDHLSIPSKGRDLFSAHEVIQMKPIYDRDQIYEKFLQQNLWAKNYLPNAIKIRNAVKTPRGWPRSAGTPPMVEGLIKSFQLWYMRNRRTNEVISDGIIRFHPDDARIWVMRKYKQKVSSYFLP